MTERTTKTLLHHEPSGQHRARAMVVEDPATRALVEQVERLAPSAATILVLGETGTGKELLARHLHTKSLRASGPFVAVNCGALTPSLVESELFGHERGAFTGALTTRPGFFERASGGTLFLDEIGELPASTQVALLRVLQEREVLRVGARAPIPVDVRVVAATHRDLRSAVLDGAFREDLYYRIAVATLSIAPLRRRPADVLALAEHFLAGHRESLGVPELCLSEDARRKLLAHDWPGNIRELENVVHLATLLRSGPQITADDLVLEPAPATAAPRAAIAETRTPEVGLRTAQAPRVGGVGAEPRTATRPQETTGPRCSGPVSASGCEPDPELSLNASIDQLFGLGGGDLHARVERALYERAIHSARGNQLEVARRLGVSRNVVRARLIEHGLLPGARRSAASSPALPPASSIRVGHQRLGVLASAGSRERVALVARAAGHEIVYAEHESGIEVVEAIGRGELDLGVVGDAPALFAEAAGTELLYVAAEPPAPERQALIVGRRSRVQTMQDLRGRAIAVSRGASSLYLALRILEEADLGLGDVELVTLKPGAAWRAFSRGDVEAWVVWEPTLGEAVTTLGARILRDGRGLAPNRAFYVASEAWAAANPLAVQTVFEALRGCDPAIGALDEEAVDAQHAIAATLRRWGFLRTAVRVRASYLPDAPPARRAS